MQINKHYFLGEALYKLSIYEKGRCYSSKVLWKKKYVIQLSDSISMMEEIIASLSNENITDNDYEIVRKIVENKEFFDLNETILNQLMKDNYSLSSIDNLSFYKEVNQLMSEIINQLNQTIKSLNKKNKLKIWYLLQALHNLPKIYFESRQESTFNSLPISCDVALECARRYLKMIN